MQLQREDQYVPVPAVSLGGQVGQSAEAAVYISLTGIGHGADDVPPFSTQFRKFLKQVFAGEPGALLLIQPGEVFIYIEPVAIPVQNLHDHVFTHGHGNA